MTSSTVSSGSSNLRADQPVQYVRGIGPGRAKAFAALGIHTVEDLLFHLPTRYEDFGQLTPIALVQPGGLAIVRGRITDMQWRPGHLPRLDLYIRDASGGARLTWFHGQYLLNKFHVGDELIVSGKAEMFNGTLQFVNPKHQLGRAAGPSAGLLMATPEPESPPTSVGGDLPGSSGALQPVYPAGGGLESRQIAQAIRGLIPRVRQLVSDPLPEALRERHGLLPLWEAVEQIHAPVSTERATAARERLAYDELLIMEIGVALKRRQAVEGSAQPVAVNTLLDERIRARFPFPLTAAQARVIREISVDLRRNRPMNRLVQGDVGSGKTVVALYAALAAVANGFQAAIMAPTEILAEQHHRNAQKYLAGSKVRIRMLTGSLTAALKRERRRAISEGEVDLIIGTQALIEENVQFDKLALVVVDEQHKFGVLQRAKFRSKGLDPHYLVMTATPIPRTLSLSYFGDLDVSLIDELPPGRQRVLTRLVPPDREGAAFEAIRKRLAAGEQGYVVCPMVEDSEESDLKSAVGEAERLSKHVFSEFKVACLHGRMSSEEKEAAMADFSANRTQLLVSTVVIEVGVDVPNATVMAVRHAERFGLSQLHQLRGRIGRGDKAATCLLFCENEGSEGRKRLEILTQTSDGFRIAEEDLRLRGPGEFFGTRQHGFPELKVADLLRDGPLVERARADAFAMVAEDPALQQPAHAGLRRRVLSAFATTLDLIRVA